VGRLRTKFKPQVGQISWLQNLKFWPLR